MRRRTTSLALTLAIVTGNGEAALAAPDFDFGADVSDDAIIIDGIGEREASRGGRSDNDPASLHRVVFTRVPACRGNEPGVPGADVQCAESAALCPSPEEAMYWLYRSPDVQPRGWTLAGQRCQGASTADAAREFPGFTQADFQRLPLPAGRPVIEPGNGYTLVGVPTNVYADAEPVTLGTSLLGFPVQVRATPSRYEWEFGDGSGHGPTSDPGSPYPELSITHEYTVAGAYPVTLVTYYAGEYSVAGGPWLPIVGEAAVRSEPVTVEALAGRNRLVAGASG